MTEIVCVCGTYFKRSSQTRPLRGVISELRPEDREEEPRAKALENKLRLFGEQTEGPVWLEYRELEGVEGREIKEGP